MHRIPIKTLLGQSYVVEVADDGTVADLACSVAGAAGTCRLYFKGVELSPPCLLLSEALAGLDMAGAASHVVAMIAPKRARRIDKGTDSAEPTVSAAAAPAATPVPPVAQLPKASKGAPPRLQLQPEVICIDCDSSDEERPPSKVNTAATTALEAAAAVGSAAAAAVGAAAGPAMPPVLPSTSIEPASPPINRPNNQPRPSGGSPLFTLLPGYASRPNPSPIARRGGGRAGASGPVSWEHSASRALWVMGPQLGCGHGTEGAHPAAPAAAAGASYHELPDAYDIAEAGGGGFLSEVGDLQGAAGQHAGAAGAEERTTVALGLAPRRPHPGRTLLQQHLLAASHQAEAHMAQVARQAQQQHVAAAAVQQHGPQLQPQQLHEGQRQEQQKQQVRQGRLNHQSAASAAVASQVWQELADELRAAPQDSAAGADGSVQQHPAQQQQRWGQCNQLGSLPLESSQAVRKRKLAAIERLDSSTGPLSVAGHQRPAGREPSFPQSKEGGPTPLDLRLHRGELTPAEVRTLDALPLPSMLTRLLRIFESLAAWQGFLVRQHMPATWANSRAHVQGLLPLDDASAVDVVLMAELAPHCIMLMEVAPSIRAALDRAYPRVSIHAPTAGQQQQQQGVEEGQHASLQPTDGGGGSSRMAGPHSASASSPQQQPPGSSAADGSGVLPSQALPGPDLLLDDHDDFILLFEMPDPGPGAIGGGGGRRGRGSSSSKGGDSRTDTPSTQRSKKPAKQRQWREDCGVAGEMGAAEEQEVRQQADAPERGVSNGLLASGVGQSAREAEAGEKEQGDQLAHAFGGGFLPEGHGGCGNGAATGAEGQQVQDGGAATLGSTPSCRAEQAASHIPVSPSGPPGPATHVGKKALARRKQAFRRTLAFAVLLVHRRFLAQLTAGMAPGDMRWRRREAEDDPSAGCERQDVNGELDKQQEGRPGAVARGAGSRRMARRGRTAVGRGRSGRGGGRKAALPLEVPAQGNAAVPPTHMESETATSAVVGPASSAQGMVAPGAAAAAVMAGQGGDESVPVRQLPSRAAKMRAREQVQQQLLQSGRAAGVGGDGAEEEDDTSSDGEPAHKKQCKGPSHRLRGHHQQQQQQQQQESEIGLVCAARGKRRLGKATADRSSPGMGGIEADSWDPLSQGGQWHPCFDTALITVGELRAAAAEHNSWLAAQLRLAGSSISAAAGPDSQQQHVPEPAPAPPRVVKRHERCCDTTPMDPRAFLTHLQCLPWYDGQLVHERDITARPARTAVPVAHLSAPTLAALASRGIVLASEQLSGTSGGDSASKGCGLFVHQAAAIDALLLQRRHTVVCTSTASGKSVCYNVPVIEALAADQDACALYLFPTKALAQDQLSALRGMLSAAFGPQAAAIVETYDGDTPQAVRSEIRSQAQLLITNPDMLHQSILPFHSSFERLLGNLKYVVVDEGHAYHGAFGCHTSLVLRRLRRLCQRVHGSDPLFVVTSATVANPCHHASLLLGLGPGEEPQVITEDGSPHGPKVFALWNPPLTAEAKAAQALGQEAPTRTEGRATSKSTYRARRQQMRVELREANAARRRGVSVVRGMSEAEWQAAVRLASGRRVLVECLFQFRHGGDRPAGLDLLPPEQKERERAEEQGRDVVGAAPQQLGDGVSRQEDAAAAAAAAPEQAGRGSTVDGDGETGGGGSGPGSGGDVGLLDDVGVIEDLFQLVRQVGVEIKEEPQEEQGEVDVDVMEAAGSQPGCQTVPNGSAAWPLGRPGQQPVPGSSSPPRVLAALASISAAPAVDRGSTPMGPPAPRPNGGLADPGPATQSAAQQKRRAAVLAQAEAALSAVTELPGAPPASCSLTGAAWQQQQQQQRRRQQQQQQDLQQRQLGSAAAEASGHSGVDLSQPVLPVGGSLSKATVPPEVQREIERALPPRAAIFERHGAAGTALDQRRESPIVETSLLLAEAVQHGLRAIAFCKSRKLSEMVAKYTRDTLKLTAPSLADSVKVYRGGYTPAERRSIEAALHSGSLAAVAATNALELGIDVGGLDLTLHLGFPGSVSSLWQQAGRAGRREQRSLSVCVAFDGPLDQHFMKHPEELFSKLIEAVQLDPCNVRLLRQHIACAAAELPILPDEDGALFGVPQLAAACSDLLALGMLSRHARAVGSAGSLASSLHYSGPDRSPAARISLRTIDPERFVVLDIKTHRVLEEIEANKAFYVVYDGAVYLHQGVTYMCASLDLDTRVARVYRKSVPFYTSVRDVTDIHVTGGKVAYPTPREALAAIDARRGVRPSGGWAAAGDACKHEDLPKQEPQQGAAGHGCQQVVSCMQGQQVAPQQEQQKQDACKQEGQEQQQQQLRQHVQEEGQGPEVKQSPSSLCCGGSSTATCESCVVTVRFLGYHRVEHGTGNIFDDVELFLPDSQFETQACYIRLPSSVRTACMDAKLDYRESVHAAAHALLNVLPLYMVCNATDVATECDNPYDTRYRPERLLLYDKHPGGIGLAAQATPLFPELLRRALDLVLDCPCTYQRGCPACVQHLDCKNYNAVLSKRGAVVVLRAAIEQERQQAGNQGAGL